MPLHGPHSTDLTTGSFQAADRVLIRTDRWAVDGILLVREVASGPQAPQTLRPSTQVPRTLPGKVQPLKGLL